MFHIQNSRWLIMRLIYDVCINKYLSLVFQILLLAHCLIAAAAADSKNPKIHFQFKYVCLLVSVFFPFLFPFANVSSWVGGGARSRQLDCPLLVLLLFRGRNPLHWSLASLLIWGKISPADGSLLKHRKRSELIPIAPVISQLSHPFLPTLLSHFSSPTLDFPPRTIKHRALSSMPSDGVDVSALLPALL